MPFFFFKSFSHVQLFGTPWSIQSMEFSRPEYWSGQLLPSSGDLPNPGIEPGSPALQGDSLPAEPPGKPKNTGMGSLSLLQQIFPTQESNCDLLHCRWILYPLSCVSYSTQGYLPKRNKSLSIGRLVQVHGRVINLFIFL